MMRPVKGLAARSADEPFDVWEFERRELRPDDVAVAVSFCGVCHTDLHAWRGEEAYGNRFPLVPGHEFVGTVTEIGDEVDGFAVGDSVAVGNIVDSCGQCESCRADVEQFCVNGPTLTYGGTDRRDGLPTYGGFSTEYVVTERFVYRLPEGLDPAGAAPLMCAGVTVWSPLEEAGVGPGDRVGVVGLGGLGHLAVKFAHALGADVDLFSTSPGKADAARALGARGVVISTDPEQMAAARGEYDVILDTVAVPHDLSAYGAALRRGGAMCLVGALEATTFDPMAWMGRTLTASGSAGRAGTQRMLEFCGRHGLTADVEVLPAASVGKALDRLARNDVRFRFSLDMAAL